MKRTDKVIDSLIKKPKFKGTFDWSKSRNLMPTGEARREKIVASRLQPDRLEER